MPDFPDVVRAPVGARAADLKRLFQSDRDLLRTRLLVSGAILFRGFGVASPEDLALLQSEMGEPMRYIGGDSPRTKLESGAKHEVYTSTEAPASVRLPLHNELSYLETQPRFLWFACSKAAPRGGETTLADGRKIVAAMDPAIRERFERDGVRYRVGFRGPGGPLAALDRVVKVNKSWMDAFETTDRSVVEAECRQRSASFEWSPGGDLTIETKRPATRRHPVTGELVWFNQAHLFRMNARYLGHTRYALARAFFKTIGVVPHDACFGDGSPIGDDVIDRVFDVLDAYTVPVRWQPGDVVLVDNVLAMHGREPFRGERKILVAMNA